MIRIERNEDSKDTMNISIVGNAEDVAKEYAALTLNLMQNMALSGIELWIM